MRLYSSMLLAVVGVCALPLLLGQAHAQQVTVSAPFHQLSDSFYERMGTSWSGNFKGIPFSVGGGSLAVPQYGGYDPNGGLNTGFAFGGRGYSGNMNLFAGQGYRQNFVTQTPSVTMMNGQTGSVQDTSQSPFVIGQIPVVGNWNGGPIAQPYLPQPVFQPSMSQQSKVDQWKQQLAEAEVREAQAREVARHAEPVRPAPVVVPIDRGALAARNPDDGGLLMGEGFAPRQPAGSAPAVQSQVDSSAGRAVPSVAMARQLRAQEDAAKNEQARALIQRGLAAEEEGKPGVAIIYYQQAASRSSDAWREKIEARIGDLREQMGQ